MTPEEIAALPYRPCVGIVLANGAGEVFAGQRIDNPGKAWQMPQGGIDPGESVRDTALRELEEETGVSIDDVVVLAETSEWIPYELPHDLVPRLWKGRFRGQQQKWVLMRFTGDDTSVNIATEHAEFSHWQWMTPDALMKAIVPFKADTYRRVFAEFARFF